MNNNKAFDEAVLMLCEDLVNTIQANKKEIHALKTDDSDQPIDRRFKLILERIETERRLIEDVSMPCRFVVEHFTWLLDEMEYTIGFQFRDVRSGRGLLNNIKVGPWGTVTIKVGDVDVSWRDHEALYMFYPDKVIIRQRDSADDDITLYFSYPFKYALQVLRDFQQVQDDPQTLYWHEGLILS